MLPECLAAKNIMMLRIFPILLLLLLRVAGQAQQTGLPVDSLISKGIRLHDEGQFDAALALFEQAVKQEPQNGLANFEAGNTCFALGDYKKALKYADKALKIDREALPEAYVLKGNSLDMLGKADKAVDAYRKGLKLDPGNYQLHFNLGVTLLRQEKFAEAEPEFIAALKTNPQYTSAHYMLGYCNAMLLKKTKTLLSFYYFLLAENQGKRADIATQFIKGTMQEGMGKTGERTFNLSVDPAALGDEFGNIDMSLSIIPIAREMSKQAMKDSLGVDIPDLSFSQQLTNYNESLFRLLGEVTERPADSFWWDTYADFFVDLHRAGHTEALTNFLLMNSEDKTAMTWLRSNGEKVQAFSDWIDAYSKRD